MRNRVDPQAEAEVSKAAVKVPKWEDEETQESVNPGDKPAGKQNWSSTGH